MSDMERIWWERVPNALSFVSDVTETLLEERSIVLHANEPIPWYSFLTGQVKESVLTRNSSRSFEFAADICEPGTYLLQKFCKAEKRAQFRPATGYEAFFAKSDDIVLHTRCLWIRVLSREQLEAWMEFVCGYLKRRGENKERAVFILEWVGSGPVRARKGLRVLSLDSYISDYDRTVFCTLAASSVKEHALIKDYLTELAVHVIGNDMELCAAVLGDHRAFLKDPYEAARKAAGALSAGGRREGAFEKTREEVSDQIWKAQIRTIYPLLEEYREDLIRRYGNDIRRLLPVESAFGEICEEPEEVELGTLKYLADTGRLFLEGRDYDRLRVCREARNKLSHLTPLSFREIQELE